MSDHITPEIRDALTAIQGQLSALRDEVQRVLASRPPLLLPPDEACEAVGISRATFDRWFSDTTSGLGAVVLQPNGPRTKLIVPMAEFRAWMAKRTRGTPRAKRPT